MVGRMTLDAETVSALADAVRNNEGLRATIRARGLDEKSVMAYLRANHREAFRMAKAGDPPDEPQPQSPPVIVPEPEPPLVFTIGGTVTRDEKGTSEYALVVKEGAP